jgi:hypothetical protein
VSDVNVGPVFAVGYPNSSLTNSTTADQDYTAICTLPANLITSARMIRVSVGFRAVSGTSAATQVNYLKLGSTKLYTFTAGNWTDGNDRSVLDQYLIVGTAAAGASVAVACFGPSATWTGGGAAQHNGTAQPVSGIATNGTLDIVIGTQWSATGSTETLYLMSYLVEIVA